MSSEFKHSFAGKLTLTKSEFELGNGLISEENGSISHIKNTKTKEEVKHMISNYSPAIIDNG